MAERHRGPHHVLIADSEVLVRHAIASYLRHCGYTVVEAATSEEVIAVLDSAKISIEAILCDAELQGSPNAFALRLWVKDHSPQVQVILAGNVEAVAKAAGELCDKGPHLKRPYDPQAVANHIKRLLAKARGARG